MEEVFVRSTLYSLPKRKDQTCMLFSYPAIANYCQCYDVSRGKRESSKKLVHIPVYYQCENKIQQVVKDQSGFCRCGEPFSSYRISLIDDVPSYSCRTLGSGLCSDFRICDELYRLNNQMIDILEKRKNIRPVRHIFTDIQKPVLRSPSLESVTEVIHFQNTSVGRRIRSNSDLRERIRTVRDATTLLLRDSESWGEGNASHDKTGKSSEDAKPAKNLFSAADTSSTDAENRNKHVTNDRKKGSTWSSAIVTDRTSARQLNREPPPERNRQSYAQHHLPKKLLKLAFQDDPVNSASTSCQNVLADKAKRVSLVRKKSGLSYEDLCRLRDSGLVSRRGRFSSAPVVSSAAERTERVACVFADHSRNGSDDARGTDLAGLLKSPTSENKTETGMSILELKNKLNRLKIVSAGKRTVRPKKTPSQEDSNYEYTLNRSEYQDEAYSITEASSKSEGNASSDRERQINREGLSLQSAGACKGTRIPERTAWDVNECDENVEFWEKKEGIRTDPRGNKISDSRLHDPLRPHHDWGSVKVADKAFKRILPESENAKGKNVILTGNYGRREKEYSVSSSPSSESEEERDKISQGGSKWDDKTRAGRRSGSFTERCEERTALNESSRNAHGDYIEAGKTTITPSGSGRSEGLETTSGVADTVSSSGVVSKARHTSTRDKQKEDTQASMLTKFSSRRSHTTSGKHKQSAASPGFESQAEQDFIRNAAADTDASFNPKRKPDKPNSATSKRQNTRAGEHVQKKKERELDQSYRTSDRDVHVYSKKKSDKHSSATSKGQNTRVGGHVQSKKERELDQSYRASDRDVPVDSKKKSDKHSSATSKGQNTRVGGHVQRKKERELDQSYRAWDRDVSVDSKKKSDKLSPATSKRQNTRAGGDVQKTKETVLDQYYRASNRDVSIDLVQNSGKLSSATSGGHVQKTKEKELDQSYRPSDAGVPFGTEKKPDRLGSATSKDENARAGEDVQNTKEMELDLSYRASDTGMSVDSKKKSDKLSSATSKDRNARAVENIQKSKEKELEQSSRAFGNDSGNITETLESLAELSEQSKKTAFETGYNHGFNEVLSCVNITKNESRESGPPEAPIDDSEITRQRSERTTDNEKGALSNRGASPVSFQGEVEKYSLISNFDTEDPHSRLMILMGIKETEDGIIEETSFLRITGQAGKPEMSNEQIMKALNRSTDHQVTEDSGFGSSKVLESQSSISSSDMISKIRTTSRCAETTGSDITLDGSYDLATVSGTRQTQIKTSAEKKASGNHPVDKPRHFDFLGEVFSTAEPNTKHLRKISEESGGSLLSNVSLGGPSLRKFVRQTSEIVGSDYSQDRTQSEKTDSGYQGVGRAALLSGRNDDCNKISTEKGYLVTEALETKSRGPIRESSENSKGAQRDVESTFTRQGKEESNDENAYFVKLQTPSAVTMLDKRDEEANQCEKKPLALSPEQDAEFPSSRSEVDSLTTLTERRDIQDHASSNNSSKSELQPVTDTTELHRINMNEFDQYLNYVSPFGQPNSQPLGTSSCNSSLRDIHINDEKTRLVDDTEERVDSCAPSTSRSYHTIERGVRPRDTRQDEFKSAPQVHTPQELSRDGFLADTPLSADLSEVSRRSNLGKIRNHAESQLTHKVTRLKSRDHATSSDDADPVFGWRCEVENRGTADSQSEKKMESAIGPQGRRKGLNSSADDDNETCFRPGLQAVSASSVPQGTSAKKILGKTFASVTVQNNPLATVPQADSSLISTSAVSNIVMSRREKPIFSSVLKTQNVLAATSTPKEGSEAGNGKQPSQVSDSVSKPDQRRILDTAVAGSSDMNSRFSLTNPGKVSPESQDKKNPDSDLRILDTTGTGSSSLSSRFKFANAGKSTPEIQGKKKPDIDPRILDTGVSGSSGLNSRFSFANLGKVSPESQDKRHLDSDPRVLDTAVAGSSGLNSRFSFANAGKGSPESQEKRNTDSDPSSSSSSLRNIREFMRMKQDGNGTSSPAVFGQKSGNITGAFLAIDELKKEKTLLLRKVKGLMDVIENLEKEKADLAAKTEEVEKVFIELESKSSDREDSLRSVLKLVSTLDFLVSVLRRDNSKRLAAINWHLQQLKEVQPTLEDWNRTHDLLNMEKQHVSTEIFQCLNIVSSAIDTLHLGVTHEDSGTMAADTSKEDVAESHVPIADVSSSGGGDIVRDYILKVERTMSLLGTNFVNENLPELPPHPDLCEWNFVDPVELLEKELKRVEDLEEDLTVAKSPKRDIKTFESVPWPIEASTREGSPDRQGEVYSPIYSPLGL